MLTVQGNFLFQCLLYLLHAACAVEEKVTQPTGSQHPDTGKSQDAKMKEEGTQPDGYHFYV